MFDLSPYTWAFRTDMDKRLLAPKDAVVLLLKDGGPLHRSELRNALKAWRPNSQWGPDAWYVYLFNGFYGHVATDIRGNPQRCPYAGQRTSKAWWYRTGRGMYDLTLTGIHRMHQLGF